MSAPYDHFVNIFDRNGFRGCTGNRRYIDDSAKDADDRSVGFGVGIDPEKGPADSGDESRR